MKKLLAAVLLLAGISFLACQKEFSYETTTDTASIGAWEFKDSANTTYAGNTQSYDVDTTNANALMDYTGITANQRGLLSISINFPTSRLATGTYTSQLGQVDFSYSTGVGNNFLYRTESNSQFSTENITVVISQITDTSITGTFSGTALDSTDKVKVVKEGKFTYKKRGVATTPTATASTGSLGTATDTCTGAVVNGTYKKAVAMTSTNTVIVTANVTATGTYTIYSDTLKGIYFRGTGNFNTTGAQQISIPALGTPTDSGTVRFRIRYGTSSCTFRVKIDTASSTTGSTVTVITPTGDYFPTTTNSNWSYASNDSGSTTISDTAYTLSTGTTSTITGNSYNWFVSNDGSGPDTSYYRKGSGLYYIAEPAADLTGTGSGTLIVNFLKDNVAQGATWTETFPVTFNGQTATATFTNVILAKAVSATVGGVSSTDVIKVGTTINISITIAGFPITYPYSYLENWYARGGGLIYSKTRDLTGIDPTSEIKLRRLTIF